MAYTVYIYEEKCWPRDFPYSPYMACTAYIRDVKGWSRDFPYSIYMACAAYIRDENVGPQTSTKACTWPK
jgi:hypothetical protein